MKPRSSTVFHFTKNESILFDIFKNGFWPKYCLEDIRWQQMNNLEFIAFPMVCFCDIPLSRISEHVEFYGHYGIGLSKNWVERNNLNPMLYVSSSSELNHSLLETMRNIIDLPESNNSKRIKDLRYILAHIKPTEGKILIERKSVTKEFYQESEWRYVPKHESVVTHLSKETYENKKQLETFDEKSKEHSSLKFEPNDVSYIFVPKDTDIPNIIDFMQSELDHYTRTALKVLYTKIISTERIEYDI